MHLRHQLPVYSPVTLRSVGAAMTKAVSADLTARAELGALLRSSFDAREVVLCGSGTQALQLAIDSVQRDVGPNALVALPAFSCFDVASAAIGARTRVVLYDIDPVSLSPDLASLEQALDSGALIVVVAPLYGIPVDWESVQKSVSSRGAVLIEDAAQGHGAVFRGAPLGGLGDISTLSFGRGKGWTGGSGGAVLFRRRENRLAQLDEPGRDASLKSAMMLAAQWGLGRPALYGVPRSMPGVELGETVYHEPRPPTAMATSAVAAVLASRDAAIAEADARRANADWIREQLRLQPRVREVASAVDGVTPGYLRFPVLAAHGLRGFGADATALGIASSYPQTLANLAALAPLIIGAREFAGAARLAAELVTLPVHSLLTDADRMGLAARIRAYA